MEDRTFQSRVDEDRGNQPRSQPTLDIRRQTIQYTQFLQSRRFSETVLATTYSADTTKLAPFDFGDRPDADSGGCLYFTPAQVSALRELAQAFRLLREVSHMNHERWHSSEEPLLDGAPVHPPADSQP